jgi:hypothetical protein
MIQVRIVKSEDIIASQYFRIGLIGDTSKSLDQLILGLYTNNLTVIENVLWYMVTVTHNNTISSSRSALFIPLIDTGDHPGTMLSVILVGKLAFIIRVTLDVES